MISIRDYCRRIIVTLILVLVPALNSHAGDIFTSISVSEGSLETTVSTTDTFVFISETISNSSNWSDGAYPTLQRWRSA